ncbi:HNH endonuclease [Leisingera caerulea]|uniref:HNH endonuclease n=1 Tax=Leisingera caerulea TaxID=506591 RepID=UPI00048768EB|nr:HNH endonuclease signature motif containing protein [Leisingera caerulea]
MLSDMLKSSLVTMNLRVVDHAALLVPQAQECGEVMKRDQERCHICGVRVPGMMEIDHLKGHRESPASDMACICQFCHNLKHPLWAGARKRIIPIFAPDMSQEDLHRLAWVALAWRNAPDDAPVDVSAVISDIEARRQRLRELLGCKDAESLFEAALGMPALIGEKEAGETLLRIDQSLRFWPAELSEGYEGLKKGSRLSTWSIGGFQVIADEAAQAIRQDCAPDFEKIRAAAEAVAAA